MSKLTLRNIGVECTEAPCADRVWAALLVSQEQLRTPSSLRPVLPSSRFLFASLFLGFWPEADERGGPGMLFVSNHSYSKWAHNQTHMSQRLNTILPIWYIPSFWHWRVYVISHDNSCIIFQSDNGGSPITCYSNGVFPRPWYVS